MPPLTFVFTFIGHLWRDLNPFVATGTYGIACRCWFWEIITRRAFWICFLCWWRWPFRWLVTGNDKCKPITSTAIYSMTVCFNCLFVVTVCAVWNVRYFQMEFVLKKCASLRSFDIFRLFWHYINRRTISDGWNDWCVWWFFNITRFYLNLNIRMITCWLFGFIWCITCWFIGWFLVCQWIKTKY